VAGWVTAVLLYSRAPDEPAGPAPVTGGSDEDRALVRAERAAATFGELTDSMRGRLLMDPVAAMKPQVDDTVATLRRLAAHTSVTTAALGRLDADFLRQERLRLTHSRESARPEIADELDRAISALTAQEQVHARLSSTRERLLVRLESTVIILEGLVARVVELSAMDVTSGADTSTALDQLTSDLELTRQSLHELDQSTRDDLPLIRPPAGNFGLCSALLQHRRQLRRSRVPARHDDGDLLTREFLPTPQHSGECRRARPFGQRVGVGEQEALRVADLVVGDQQEVGQQLAHHRLRQRVGGSGGQAVHPRFHRAQHHLTEPPRVVRGRSGGGLDADHLTPRCERPRHQAGGSGTGSTAHRDHDRVEVGLVAEDLQVEGPDPGDDLGLVGGTDQPPPEPVGLRAGHAGRLDHARPADHDRRPQRLDGGDLGRVRVLRHHDRARHPEQARREGDRLRVVPRRPGHHAALTVGHGGEEGDPTAHLESADRLGVLVLDPQFRPGDRVEDGVAPHGRRRDVPGEEGGGPEDVAHVRHGDQPEPTCIDRSNRDMPRNP